MTLSKDETVSKVGGVLEFSWTACVLGMNKSIKLVLGNISGSIPENVLQMANRLPKVPKIADISKANPNYVMKGPGTVPSRKARGAFDCGVQPCTFSPS